MRDCVKAVIYGFLFYDLLCKLEKEKILDEEKTS